jgi:hypothetical protein
MRPPWNVSSVSGEMDADLTNEIGSAHSESGDVGALACGLFKLQFKVHHKLNALACLGN